jgi:hypothetical protein
VADNFREFANRLERLEDPKTLMRIADKAGVAGKKAALDAAAKALGGDRRFSGMRKKTALSAGYDVNGPSSVSINLRPAGLWMLAEDGRKRSGPIYPRRGARKGSGAAYGRAVMTPYGPRARSSYGPSRGSGAVSDVEDRAKRDVPKAAAQQFTAEVARIVR